MFLGYEASAPPSSPLISPTGVIVTAFFFLIPHHIMDNPTIPTIAAFNAAMILSTDRLFFISTPMGTNGVREWRLIQLDNESSVRSSPYCIETGKFLCDFYISHPSDWRFNAINQRFWLQHFKADLLNPDQAHESHLIKPSSTSRAYAIKNHLVVAKKYVHMLHEDTFINGPFDFASVHNRKTHDRIAQVSCERRQVFLGRFGTVVP